MLRKRHDKTVSGRSHIFSAHARKISKCNLAPLHFYPVVISLKGLKLRFLCLDSVKKITTTSPWLGFSISITGAKWRGYHLYQQSCICLKLQFQKLKRWLLKNTIWYNFAKTRICSSNSPTLRLFFHLPYSQFVPFHPGAHSHWDDPSSLTVQLPLLLQRDGDSMQGDTAKQTTEIQWSNLTNRSELCLSISKTASVCWTKDVVNIERV